MDFGCRALGGDGSMAEFEIRGQRHCNALATSNSTASAWLRLVQKQYTTEDLIVLNPYAHGEPAFGLLPFVQVASNGSITT